MTTALDVSTLFARTESGKAALAQLEEQRLAERQEHADAIERLQAASKATRPDLVKSLAAAKSKLEKAKLALEKARRNRRLAKDAIYSHDARLTKAIQPLEAALVASADPAIDQFVDELDQLTDETRKATVQHRTEMGRDILGRERPGKAYSTYAAICRKLDAIRDARANALSLKTQVGVDVAAEITKLRDAISKIDISKYEEV